MRTVTASEGAERFWELLDVVENGERVTITRDQVAIAEMRPVRRRTGADLRDALEGSEPGAG
ncbi:type II toxin-antitoxin system Phd/YefM family antitoxin [Nocardiopsis lucentensis]|uniref:type II toxin-antitoxin system Phd/YefM family antitoxin n=1 Tax=Nocardiopsis lucentensis TaxID=53441 RepID=UPI000380E9F6|nr:hypothetical protein [Nocardiopsis lucentensis]